MNKQVKVNPNANGYRNNYHSRQVRVWMMRKHCPWKPPRKLRKLEQSEIDPEVLDARWPPNLRILLLPEKPLLNLHMFLPLERIPPSLHMCLLPERLPNHPILPPPDCARDHLLQLDPQRGNLKEVPTPPQPVASHIPTICQSPMIWSTSIGYSIW